MKEPLALISEHGLSLVFANVMVEQLGVPIPAVPTLVVSGALAVQGEISAAAVFAVTLLACLIADGVWYVAGKRYGLGILKVLCKVSLSADSCVRQTEIQFERWGSLGLIFGKFIPGVSTLAPPLAGAMGIGWVRFVLFNTLGCCLWAAAAIGGGMLFHRQISGVITLLESFGVAAVQVIALLLAVYIAFKWWERRRFFRMMRGQRISVAELRSLMDEGKSPVVVDVRAPSLRERDGRFIPGAIAIDLAQIESRHAELPGEREIVFYCTCPNEASAAVAAKQLIGLGYTRVRPLRGGLDEWIAAGYEVERRALSTPA